MLKIKKLTLIAVSLLLTGCSTSYVSTHHGPTATLAIRQPARGTNSVAVYDDPYKCLGPQHMIAGNVGAVPPFIISTDNLFTFEIYHVEKNLNCQEVLSFYPKPHTDYFADVTTNPNTKSCYFELFTAMRKPGEAMQFIPVRNVYHRRYQVRGRRIQCIDELVRAKDS